MSLFLSPFVGVSALGVSFDVDGVIFGGLIVLMSEKQKVWAETKVSNLIKRVESGIYYARIRVNGREKKGSLGTTKFAVAKVKLPLKLNEMRAAAEGAGAMRKGGFENLRGCLEEWWSVQSARPDLKESTQSYNKRRYEDLLKMLPVDEVISRVGAAELRAWWKDAAKKFNPRYANNLLSVVRDVVDMQVKAGLRTVNPAADFKRMPIPQTIKDLPSTEEMTAVIDSIRAQKKRSSEECADLVAWMAFTGMRPAEAKKMRWEDVMQAFVVVRQGKKGTKNYKERAVPIMDELREQIARRSRRSGEMWSISDPKKALGAACERLGINHLTPYSLRHYFATKCLESGVDVPTVSKWLGHSDGGALVMKTYGHVSDAHGLVMSKRVKLGSRREMSDISPAQRAYLQHEGIEVPDGATLFEVDAIIMSHIQGAAMREVKRT